MSYVYESMMIFSDSGRELFSSQLQFSVRFFARFNRYFHIIFVDKEWHAKFYGTKPVSESCHICRAWLTNRLVLSPDEKLVSLSRHGWIIYCRRTRTMKWQKQEKESWGNKRRMQTLWQLGNLWLTQTHWIFHTRTQHMRYALSNRKICFGMKYVHFYVHVNQARQLSLTFNIYQ